MIFRSPETPVLVYVAWLDSTLSGVEHKLRFKPDTLNSLLIVKFEIGRAGSALDRADGSHNLKTQPRGYV